jgi:hypothetical protein
MNPFADSMVASIAFDKMAEASAHLRQVVAECLKEYSCPYCGATGGAETFEISSVVTKTELFSIFHREPTNLYSRALALTCRKCEHKYEYPAGRALPEEVNF